MRVNKPIVVLLGGEAGVGKTTFGAALLKALDAHKILSVRASFAESLKSAVSGAERKFNTPLTNWGSYDEKAAARPLLVELGKHLRRLDPDVFVRYLFENVIEGSVSIGIEVLIVDDWRYLNEWRYLSEHVGTVIPVRLNRACAAPANDEEASSLATIDAVLEELHAHVSVPEWKSSEECADNARSLAAYLEGIIGVRRTLR